MSANILSTKKNFCGHHLVNSISNTHFFRGQIMKLRIFAGSFVGLIASLTASEAISNTFGSSRINPDSKAYYRTVQVGNSFRRVRITRDRGDKRTIPSSFYNMTFGQRAFLCYVKPEGGRYFENIFFRSHSAERGLQRIGEICESRGGEEEFCATNSVCSFTGRQMKKNKAYSDIR